MMDRNTDLRYIRRTRRARRPGLHSYYEWWNEEHGWSRSRLEASALPETVVKPVLRALKMEDDPDVIQTIALPVR